jgi:hypothetical protein
MLKEYEDQQSALVRQREDEERQRMEAQQREQAEFERRQREQEEMQRQAQEQLMRTQMDAYNNQAAQQMNQLQQEMLAMRGQYERDQLLLEQYDRVSSSWSVGRKWTLIVRPIASESSRRRNGRYERKRRGSTGLQG